MPYRGLKVSKTFVCAPQVTAVHTSRFVPLLRPWPRPRLFLVFFSILNLLRFHLILYLRVSTVDLRISGFAKSAQVHYGLFALAQKN